MKRVLAELARYGLLIAVTVVAVAVMVWVSSRTSGIVSREERLAPVSVVAQTRPPVEVHPLQAELCELTASFSGKLRPWETYELAFEVPGRVVSLGTNDDGSLLDVGDRVRAGQFLAGLDDRIYKARSSEAAAQLEEATSDMNRIRRLRESRPGAITESDFQQQLTAVALARAGQEVVLKNLDDAVITAPVNATVARRDINVGESVGANQMAFELVEDDDMLLVIDVPESSIRELQLRQRKIESQRRSGSLSVRNKEDAVFRAYVTLEGRDQFGRQWPTIDAEVYQIAQVADARTGLFEVEIRVPNEERLLRAGMVATARVVVDRIPAYKIPEEAVIFRAGEAFLFTVDRGPAPVEVMFWDVGQTQLLRARRVNLENWTEQGDDTIVPAEQLKLDSVIVRGQQRLADGQHVRLADEANIPLKPAGPELARPPATVRMNAPTETEQN